MPYCAIPPLDQSATRVGRGFGLGYNRERTRADQLHAGMDFVASSRTPILAPLPGTVSAVSFDNRILNGMAGYGNAVAIRHDFDLPGLPRPFWTLYAHMRQAPTLTVGQHVSTGDLLGEVGNTTNGRFAGMGSHLHFEVRRTGFPSSYDRDTIDPAILFRALGVDQVGGYRDVERTSGGQLLVREGGPSDCRAAGVTSSLARLAGLRAVPSGYIDPSSPLLKAKYESKGTSAPATSESHPPDYSNQNVSKQQTETESSPLLWIGAGALVVGAIYFMRRR